jgi:hypothetical protein
MVIFEKIVNIELLISAVLHAGKVTTVPTEPKSGRASGKTWTLLRREIALTS